MADSFTADQIQGVLGQFKPVLDAAVPGGDFSADNVQGILGRFEPVLDEAAGAAVAVPDIGWLVRQPGPVRETPEVVAY
jgi:hypothetical protein